SAPTFADLNATEPISRISAAVNCGASAAIRARWFRLAAAMAVNVLPSLTLKAFREGQSACESQTHSARVAGDPTNDFHRANPSAARQFRPIRKLAANDSVALAGRNQKLETVTLRGSRWQLISRFAFFELVLVRMMILDHFET
ncbi:MAG TPA: hypothetical protein VLX58_17645, partial [Bryobacteraceae bacterium]|nr:hypothetical protein [Bryobacteraceae bacterium]